MALMSFDAVGFGCVRALLLGSLLTTVQAEPPKGAPPSSPAAGKTQSVEERKATTPAAPAEQLAPSYKAPKEVVDAFVAATAKKDWKATFRCFAADAQDLLVVQVITMFQYSAAGSEEVQAGLEALLKKHNFDAAKAWSEANAAATASKKESKRSDARQLVKSFSSSIKNKELLFIDLLNWANEHYAGSDPTPMKPTAFGDLTTAGDTATGTLSNGASETWKVTLRATEGNWLLVLPEAQYEPSGWNDGFLFGYLDAIHQWRF